MADNFDSLLDKAFDFHKSGKFEEAKNIYESILNIQPDNVEALNLYGQLSASVGDYDKSIELFNRLYEIKNIDDVKIQLAKTYMLKGDYTNAIKLFNQILEKDIKVLEMEASCYTKIEDYNNAVKLYEEMVKKSDNPMFSFNLAICYKNIKMYEKSLQLALSVLEKIPTDVNLLLHISSLYNIFKDSENELFYLQKAALISNNKILLKTCAMLSEKLKKLDLAIFFYNKLLEINPDDLDIQIKIAEIYEIKNPNLALKLLYDLSNKFPNNKNIISNLCNTLQILIKYDEAAIYAKTLLTLDNLTAEDYLIAGLAFSNANDYKNAELALKTAYKMNPTSEFIQSEYAEVLETVGKGEKAIEIIQDNLTTQNAKQTYCEHFVRNREAEKVKELFYELLLQNNSKKKIKDRAQILFNKFNINSKYSIDVNEFHQLGSEALEKEIKKSELITSKQWKNESLEKKKLLILSQNGMGDMIMNLRYLNFLKKYSKNITLACPTSIIDLVKYNFPEFNCILQNDDVYKINTDYITSYFKLFYNFGCDLKNIPYPDKFLNIDKKLIKDKSKLIKSDKKKIGIFWQGNPLLLFNRSSKLSDFKQFIEDKSIQLYSLQLENIDDNSAEILEQSDIIDLKPHIKTYSDTAAILKNLDLLITIDSSITHLAGALGIKTYLMLPYKAEWRWFHDTETTPWYDSIRIFKQSENCNWNEVLDKIYKEVKNEKQIL